MKKALVPLLALLVVLSFTPAQGYAAESQGYLFTAEMIASTDQIDNVGYYHVPGEPGETITLQAQLTNLSDQTLEIKAVPMNAYSAKDGIFYQSPLEENTQSFTLADAQYGLAQYMTELSPISLSPLQEETVTFSVTLPNLDVGTLLGSIRFIAFAGTESSQNGEKQQESARMLIDKYQAIDTAIQIDLPQKANPSITMGEPIFSEKKLSIKLSNMAAIIQGNLIGTYEISDSKTAVLYSGTIPSFKMAPMTEFQYPLSLQELSLEAGTYALSIKLNVNDQETTFNKSFTINDQGSTEATTTQE